MSESANPEYPPVVRLLIPDPSLVLLIGPSGSGKTTFARRCFLGTEVISSDQCRAMIVDDESDQSVSAEAFALLHHIARARLDHHRLTVIDATNLDERARRPLREMARAASVPAVAIAFKLSEDALLANNLARQGRVVPPEAITAQAAALATTLAALRRESYAFIYWLDETSAPQAQIDRVPGER